MAQEYLKANLDVTFADIAVEISNKMIQKYFQQALKLKMVNYGPLVILLNGLETNSYKRLSGLM
jgi:hypothetical protein